MIIKNETGGHYKNVLFLMGWDDAVTDYRDGMCFFGHTKNDPYNRGYRKAWESICYDKWNDNHATRNAVH